jgi:hypothetical protein
MLGLNLERFFDVTYFGKSLKSLMHGGNLNFTLKFGETFKLESSITDVLNTSREWCK